MSGSFPPTGPTSVQKVIPSYLFEQFFDDDDLQALVFAFNQLAQSRVDWFNTINLPIYTSPTIAGALLDLVADGLYGIRRPALPYGSIQTIGPYNTWAFNAIAFDTTITTGSINYFVTTDDIFKRIITWHFFKGDNQNFTAIWLKRRVTRFLIGAGGMAPNIDQTYQVGVARNGNNITITITLTPTGNVTLAIAQVFAAAVQSGAVALPFQNAFNVVIVNNLVPTGLTNVAGVLHVTILTGWPTSATGLAAGSVWSNAGVVTVVPGQTPNPFASPMFFGVVTSAGLLALGGGNLPLSNPGVGSGQLWNNSNVVDIA